MDAEFHGFTGPDDVAPYRIDLYVADPHQRDDARTGPPRHRAQARQQLLDGKRLDQIVVRALVQALDVATQPVARGQDDNRGSVVGVPASTSAVPVRACARQLQVQQDQRRSRGRSTRRGPGWRRSASLTVWPASRKPPHRARRPSMGSSSISSRCNTMAPVSG